MRPSDLKGKNVIAIGGKLVGEVSDIEFETSSWKVTRLRVRLSDDAVQTLGYKKPRIGHVEIPVTIDLINGVSDVVTLSIPINELQAPKGNTA